MFKITDNGKGGYRVALLSDPDVFRNADTYGMAEAYGHEMTQWRTIDARNTVYEQMDEERILEQANALMAKRRGRPKKVVLVEEDAPAEPAPVDTDTVS